MGILTYFGWALIYFFATMVFIGLLPHAKKSGFWFLTVLFGVLAAAGVAVSGGWVIVSLALGVGFGILISD